LHTITINGVGHIRLPHGQTWRYTGIANGQVHGTPLPNRHMGPYLSAHVNTLPPFITSAALTPPDACGQPLELPFVHGMRSKKARCFVAAERYNGTIAAHRAGIDRGDCA